MDNKRTRLQAEEFERMWDGLQSGRTADPTTTLAPEVITMARRLQALNQRSITEPTFERNLWEDFMNQAALAGSIPPLPSTNPLPNPNGRVQSTQRRAAGAPPRHLRIPGFVRLAAVFLLISALGIGFLRFAPLGIGPKQEKSIPAVVAPLEVENNNVTMYRANPAHTGEMPGPGPDPTLSIAERWSFSASGVIGTPSVVDGVAYAGSFDHNVYALDAATGEQRWVFPTGGEVFSVPTVANGIVYVGSVDANVYALDAATGEQRWAFAAGGEVYSSQAVMDGVVYASSNDGNVYAIDATSGEKLWSFFAGVGGLESSPAVVDGVVFVGSGDGNVYAIDAASGEERWAFTTGGYVFSSPAVVDGVVYVGSRDQHVYAIKAESGAQLWAFDAGDVVNSSPAVVDGVVYIGSGAVVNRHESKLYALDAGTGEERWSFLTGDIVYGSPVVADGVVYIGSWDFNLYALDSTSGEQVWSFTAGGEVDDAVVVNGVVYLASEDFKLYALESAGFGTPSIATPSA